MIEKETNIEEDDLDSVGRYFLYVLIIIVAVVDFVVWDSERFYKYNHHSYVLGFISWLVYSVQSQEIIDKRLFIRYLLIGILIFILLLIKQILTTMSFSALLASLLPLYYLGLLRLLIYIYFPRYPQVESMPVIVNTGRGRQTWKNKSRGYLPTNSEKDFSRLLDIFSVAYYVLVIFLGILSLR